MLIQTSLPLIEQMALERETENQRFVEELKTMNSEEVDAKVQQLNTAVEPQINCTQCGNCCKSLMVNVTNEEADNAATHLEITREEFDTRYLEKGSHELMIMNRMPCAFLSNNACTIYEHRFAGCREFPALHLPHFTRRLFTVMMHYNRCPIIFNVVEALKTETSFLPNLPE
ncbi:MAG: YkgJ family cysteine cluster protein [Chitinophagaceae bacterium]|nr:YkgJ family cysteine cluster protein [Chitinophagaceae bacterium]